MEPILEGAGALPENHYQLTKLVDQPTPENLIPLEGVLNDGEVIKSQKYLPDGNVEPKFHMQDSNGDVYVAELVPAPMLMEEIQEDINPNP